MSFHSICFFFHLLLLAFFAVSVFSSISFTFFLLTLTSPSEEYDISSFLFLALAWIPWSDTGHYLCPSLPFLAQMCATPHDAPPPKCPCRVSTAANQTTERRSRTGCRFRRFRNLVLHVLKSWHGPMTGRPQRYVCNYFVTSLFGHRLSPSTGSPDGASGFTEWSSLPMFDAQITVAHGGICQPLVHHRPKDIKTFTKKIYIRNHNHLPYHNARLPVAAHLGPTNFA